VAVTVISGVAGVVANGGHSHAVTHSAILGYHMTGSTGSAFLYGAAVGALAMLGLSLLAAGVGRSSRRGLAASASLAQSRRETAAVTQHRDDLAAVTQHRDDLAAVTQHRDDLIMQRDTACAYTVLDEQRNYTASALADDDGSPRADRDPGLRDPQPGRPRPAARQPAGRPETVPLARPAAHIPASAPASAE